MTRLATLAAGQVAATADHADTHGGQGGDDLEAVELAIRTAMLALGGRARHAGTVPIRPD